MRNKIKKERKRRWNFVKLGLRYCAKNKPLLNVLETLYVWQNRFSVTLSTSSNAIKIQNFRPWSKMFVPLFLNHIFDTTWLYYFIVSNVPTIQNYRLQYINIINYQLKKNVTMSFAIIQCITSLTREEKSTHIIMCYRASRYIL